MTSSVLSAKVTCPVLIIVELMEKIELGI